MDVFIHRSAVERKKDKGPVEPNWQSDPDPQDFPAARSFLGLVMPDAYADKAVEMLRAAPPSRARAKDLVRGSSGEMAPEKFPGVQKEMENLADGSPVAPLLVVQGQPNNMPDLLIADGWHRAHAAYYTDPDMWVPIRIAKGVFDDDAS